MLRPGVSPSEYLGRLLTLTAVGRKPNPANRRDSVVKSPSQVAPLPDPAAVAAAAAVVAATLTPAVPGAAAANPNGVTMLRRGSHSGAPLVAASLSRSTASIPRGSTSGAPVAGAASSPRMQGGATVTIEGAALSLARCLSVALCS